MQGETRASILTWAAAAAGVILVGPIVGWLAAWTRTPDGAVRDTVFTAEAPLLAGLGVALAIAVATVAGLVVRLALTKRFALLVAGLCLSWLAFGSGRLETLVYELPPEAALTRLALDATFLMLLALPAAALLLAGPPAGRFAHHTHPEPDDVTLSSADSLLAVPAAAAVALLGVYLVAQSGMRGQTLAAGIAGGVAGGLAVRLVFQRAHPLTPIAGVLLAGVAAPIIARIMLPTSAAQAVFDERMFTPARLAPADWLVGAWTGVAVGQYFALSLVDQSGQAEKPSSAL
jgi:hypothetical protein